MKYQRQLLIRNNRIDHRILFLGIIFMSAILISACTLPFLSSQENDNYQQSLDSTVAAMNFQATSIAQQATQEAQSMQATMLAQQESLLATQQAALAQQGEQTAAKEIGETSPETTEQPDSSPPLATEEPVETTPLTTEEPEDETDTPEETETIQMDDVDMDAKIKSAKILLFEDVSGVTPPMVRMVKESLDSANYSYTDVGSAQGWLKDQLMSDSGWDLIIMSSEYGGRITGEYFDYIMEYASKGTAIILEFWDLDAIFQGKSKTLLDECGIEFEKDWTGGAAGTLRFLQPDNLIFHEPNEMTSALKYSTRVWNDGGDLVKIKRYGGKVLGDAVLLIGLEPENNDSRAVLTSCMGGRVLIQTYTTHQYNAEDMTRLWQNYVYYTLKNHFLYLNEID
ncbi:MAG: hypothetical protein JW908_14220 [Anaerolineales bacterium]|nr:hypothetical protein [Anaerolineales bacterium]